MNYNEFDKLGEMLSAANIPFVESRNEQRKVASLKYPNDKRPKLSIAISFSTPTSGARKGLLESWNCKKGTASEVCGHLTAEKAFIKIQEEHKKHLGRKKDFGR